MTDGEMIANFYAGEYTPPGLWILWLWVGIAFGASVVVVILYALLWSRVVFGINLVENANRRAENAEDEIIRFESKIEAQDIEILYLRNENETLRELARRKGFFSHEEENNDFGRFGFRHAQPDEETAEAEWMNRKFETKK